MIDPESRNRFHNTELRAFEHRLVLFRFKEHHLGHAFEFQKSVTCTKDKLTKCCSECQIKFVLNY